MKTLNFAPLLATAIAAGLLISCQAQGGVSKSDFNTVKTDVNALKLSVYGDPRAKCPEDKIVDLSAYPVDTPDALDDFAEWHKINGAREGVITTASGLQYKVAQKGADDGPKPVNAQIVKVNYHGFFPNGDTFDSSYERGAPIEFSKNGVIRGWIEALGEMKPCDAWQLYVPGDLAYGPNGRGSIPPNATLLFNVQLLEVKDSK